MDRLTKAYPKNLAQHADRIWRAFRTLPDWAQRTALYASMAALLWWGTTYHEKLRAATQSAALANPLGSIHYQRELGGDRLRQGLLENGFPKEEVSAILKTLKKVGGPGRYKEGDYYRIVRSTWGEFRHLALNRGLERVVVTRAGTDFKASISPMPLRETTFHAQGKVDSVLWLSMSRENIPERVIQQFVDIFQWTVDFLTETREGDRFAVTWVEQRTPEGMLHDLTTQAALYEGSASGRNIGIRFEAFYYDENGEALERVFLRAPLKYGHISSTFSKSRWHPILRKRRPHHGIDYSAPYGTKVVSVGDGSVAAVGWNGGLGKRIEIRHSPVYTTIYGHLSRYEKNIHPGVRVRQGQVIGYVGATGLATGPHLHFQIAKHGTWVNFLKLNLPKARSILKEKMTEFASLRDQHLSRWE